MGLRSRRHYATVFDDADAHYVDQWVVVERLVELHLAADVWHSDAVAVV